MPAKPRRVAGGRGRARDASPPLPDFQSTRAGRQRYARLVRTATRKWCNLLCHLLANGVMPITRTAEASDVARMRCLVDEGRKCSLSEVSLVTLAILDWAARSPSLTCCLISGFPAVAAAGAEWPVEAALAYFKEKQAALPSRSFWVAQSRLCTEQFLQCATAQQLQAVAMATSGGQRLRCAHLQNRVAELPHIGPYLGFALVRALADALGVRLRGTAGAACAMSVNTSKISGIIPMQLSADRLKAMGCGQFTMAFMGWMYCEAVKVLKAEGVLNNLASYVESDPRLVRHLASKGMTRVISLAGARKSPTAFAETEERQAMRQLFAYMGDDHSSTNVLSRWRAFCRRR